MAILSLKKIHPDAITPTKATSRSSGYDLYSVSGHILRPGERALIGTGLALTECATNTDLQIRPRSGLALKYGITVLNAPGTIDPDYRDEIKVLLINLSDQSYEIKAGDRIAQMIVGLCYNEATTEKERGGGFGSSGD